MGVGRAFGRKNFVAAHCFFKDALQPHLECCVQGVERAQDGMEKVKPPQSGKYAEQHSLGPGRRGLALAVGGAGRRVKREKTHVSRSIGALAATHLQAIAV